MEVITTKLKTLERTGQLKALQDTLIKWVEAGVKRPRVVADLPRATVAKRYVMDPTLVVKEDLADHKGQVFAKKGTRLNPLDYVSWGKPLLLIDGDDEDQVAWAKVQQGSIVLVKGSPVDLETSFKQPVYFDQGGKIAARFNLTQVPARIVQEGKVLVVEETPPERRRTS